MNRKCFTFDLGALKTVKLPKPPFFKVGLLPVAFLFLPTTGFFFVPNDACDELDDDWLGLSPLFFGKRNEGRFGRTPPCGITQPRSNYKRVSTICGFVLLFFYFTKFFIRRYSKQNMSRNNTSSTIISCCIAAQFKYFSCT